MIDTVRFLTEGFTLGIATGHLCLATCGPVYAPFLMQYKKTPLRYVLAVLELSLGRFVAYVAIGALAGILGHKVSDIDRSYFTLAAYLLFSAFLIVSSIRSRKCDGACRTGSVWARFSEWPVLLGVLTGINFCPSFLLAFARSFELSGPAAGMVFFAAFFAGTSLFLLPLSFVGMLGRKELVRTVARVVGILVAAWFILNAAFIAYRLFKYRS
jgi:sulfite exporter TauE/SafE